MKIRTMLMISAMLFAILPMVIYTVFANTLLSSDGDKQFRDTLLEVAENERYTLQTYLDTVDKQAETILKNTEVQDVIKSQKTTDYVGNYLVQFANENPEIDSISLVDKDGKIFCGSTGKIGQVIDNFSAYDSYADGALYYNAIINPEGHRRRNQPHDVLQEASGRRNPAYQLQAVRQGLPLQRVRRKHVLQRFCDCCGFFPQSQLQYR